MTRHAVPPAKPTKRVPCATCGRPSVTGQCRACRENAPPHSGPTCNACDGPITSTPSWPVDPDVPNADFCFDCHREADPHCTCNDCIAHLEEITQ
jgi:hypothetical protein